MKALGVFAAGMLFAVAATPAGAQETSDQPAQTAQQSAEQQKKVCRSQRVTGSLTRRIRTCMTQAEWDRQAQGTQRSVDNIVRDAEQWQPPVQSGAPG